MPRLQEGRLRMTPARVWSRSMEWPKLDLPKNHLTHLALAWMVPYTTRAAAAFGHLLSAEGSFYGALSYTRGKVLHYRIEAAQLTGEEGDSLTVTVQYQTNYGLLAAIPKFLQDEAWLLEGLMDAAGEIPILCNAGFLWANAPTLQTAFPLPFRMPTKERFPPIDEIIGIRGVKHEKPGDVLKGYSFTLDRLPENDVTLNLEFSIAAGPADRAPQSAVSEAAFIARRIVFENKK
jgi:hypothetical protein